MIVDSTTCVMEQNQLKKNKLGGLLIVSSKKSLKGYSSKGVNESNAETARTYNMSQKEKVNSSQMSSMKGASKLDHIRNFSQIYMDNCVVSQNGNFGVAIIQFYGAI